MKQKKTGKKDKLTVLIEEETKLWDFMQIFTFEGQREIKKIIYQIAQKWGEIQKKEMIEEIKAKKFPIGERQWCIKCGNNISKFLKSVK